MDGTIGEIRMFAGNFAPRNWAFCEGQIMPIAANQALFSILTTTYGGDGKSTYGLPDLRGRANVGPGNGPGLPDYRLGQKGGAATTTLNSSHLPSHTHAASGTVKAAAVPGNERVPSNTLNFAGDPAGTPYSATAPNTNMAANNVEVTVGNTGSGQSFDNMQPYLACYYIICLNGLFPSRS